MFPSSTPTVVFNCGEGLTTKRFRRRSRHVALLCLVLTQVLFAPLDTLSDPSKKFTFRRSGDLIQGRIYRNRAETGLTDHYIVRHSAPVWQSQWPVLSFHSAGQGSRDNGETDTPVRESSLRGGSVIDLDWTNETLACLVQTDSGSFFTRLDTSLRERGWSRLSPLGGSGQGAHIRIWPEAGLFGILGADHLLLIDSNGRSVRSPAPLRARAFDVSKGGLGFVVSTHESISVVTRIHTSGFSRSVATIPLYDRYVFRPFGENMALFAWSESGQSCFAYIFDSTGTLVVSALASGTPPFVDVFDRGGQIHIVSARLDPLGLQVSAEVFNPGSKIRAGLVQYDVPETYSEVSGLSYSNGRIFLLFRSALMSFDADGSLVSLDRFPLSAYLDLYPELRFDGRRLWLSGENSSMILEQSEQPYWFVALFWQRTKNYLLLGLVLAAFLFVLQRYLRQRRMLETALNIPDAGIAFLVDANTKTRRMNRSAAELLGMRVDVPRHRPFSYYASSEAMAPLRDFVTSAIDSRIATRTKFVLATNKGERELLWTAVPVEGLAAKFIGVLVTGIDITEALEKKRLTNWAQLAHDMQTNLSIIRLNAEQMSTYGPDDVDRKKKVLLQASLLLRKVRDIVTVGRSDSLDLADVTTQSIFDSVRNEFDPALIPDIKIEVNDGNFAFRGDLGKLTRAVRNAVENGIRAMPDKCGTIVLFSSQDAEWTYLGVRDTGAGMDDETLANMMKPFFTTSQREGGSGLGTMIMQRVAELHGGKVDVESTPGVGTTVTFRIPRL